MIKPDKYTAEVWDSFSHVERILELKILSKTITSNFMLKEIKKEIEYYQNICSQIKKLTH